MLTSHPSTPPPAAATSTAASHSSVDAKSSNGLQDAQRAAARCVVAAATAALFRTLLASRRDATTRSGHLKLSRAAAAAARQQVALSDSGPRLRRGACSQIERGLFRSVAIKNYLTSSVILTASFGGSTLSPAASRCRCCGCCSLRGWGQRVAALQLLRPRQQAMAWFSESHGSGHVPYDRGDMGGFLP